MELDEQYGRYFITATEEGRLFAILPKSPRARQNIAISTVSSINNEYFPVH